MQQHYVYEGPIHEKYLSSGTETLLSFKPRLSNDLKLEMMISEMLSLVNTRMRPRLEQCFVVTQFNDEFRAYVSRHRQKLDGEIIFFADGLSNAIFLYSVLLAWFVFHAMEFERQGIEHRSTFKVKNSRLTEVIVKEKIDRYAKNLGKLQSRWNERGRLAIDETDLNYQVEMFWEAPQPVANLAVAFASFAHKFIIGHEYAHYLLGHLEVKDNYFELSKIFADHMFTAPSPSVLKEYEADLISLALNSGAFMEQQRLSNLRITGDAFSGMALTLTVLGQITDSQKESETHPAIIDRFAQCGTILNAFGKKDDKATLGMYNSFQRFLFETQNRGIWEAIRSYQHPVIKKDEYGARFIKDTISGKSPK
ncbi:MAG TPA: hypothetical protein VLQ45_00060 [Thermoanaerobaculia bacterium]|nr:hypothetical protein [Thermoanaerobaculia bacterium]